jgi:hypothetical protein
MLVVRIRDRVACAGIRRVNRACMLTDATNETTMKSKPRFDPLYTCRRHAILLPSFYEATSDHPAFPGGDQLWLIIAPKRLLTAIRKDSYMTPIKIQCGCGQRYAFDVEPVHGRMPSPVARPVCGAGRVIAFSSERQFLSLA